MTSPILNNKQIIDVVKYKWVWIALSALLIVPGIVAMIYSSVIYPTHSPMRLGIDFTGGTLIQYGFEKELNKQDVTTIREGLESIGVENPIIQIEGSSKILKKSSQQVKKNEKKSMDINSVVSIRTRFLDNDKENNEVEKVNALLKEKFGKFELLQVNAIGPVLGQELFKNAVIALLLAFAGIVLYLAIRFQLDYAIMALFALFHDALFVCGVFSILGLLFAIQIDSLFITAILTVIGFSVHDTIVVFDRIRENSRFLAKKKSFNEIVNASVNQTLARSINTSVTTLVVLISLFLLGGVTTKDFVLAMILGIAIGTYSSIFFASMFLALWRSKKQTRKFRPAV